jgi:iron complex outermembrane receptor protein
VADDGAAVSGAQISVEGTGKGGITNARGAFLVLNVPVGTYTVSVQSIGYESAEVSVTVTAGETSTHNFRIGHMAVAVEGVAVTVGSRAAHTAADELAVPVDVYSQTEILAATPQLEMASALQELSPSIFFPRPQIADLTSGVRPFQLRGLSPDHSLVLINGKRRHPTAVVHVFGAGAMGSGSSGVDMNAIVPSAIGGMNILRDGAAAQYGSDAIAGVINVQLRDDIHAPEMTMSLGQYRTGGFSPDGNRAEFSGSWGLGLGEKGTLVLSGMYSARGETERAGPDPRDQIVPGDADVVADVDGDGVNEVVTQNNPVNMPNHVIGDGASHNMGFMWNMNYGLGEDQTNSLYTFGGYTFRRDRHSGYYRRGIDNRNWPTIHPMGFLPHFRGDTQDFMAVGGLRGFLGDWNYDVSTQWDRDRLDVRIYNTLNVSLGPCLDSACAPGPDGIMGTADDPGVPNKTDVYAGALVLNQATTQADFSRGVDIGTASPLTVSLGGQFRADNFQILAGEEASWVNGWHPNRSGGIAPPGSQVFTGYRPDQAVSKWRTNVGAYIDLENDITDKFLLAGAARFENYSDFGSTVTGKLAARLQPAKQFIIRGAVSTGFRAPGLNQSYYTHVSTGFRNDGSGNQVAYEIGEIPVESPEARALGAQPLKEETSRDYSGGIALTPVERLTFTVDAYRVSVDNRIILSGSLSGPTVEELLRPYGSPTVKFFSNAVDTRTTGVDISAQYRHLLEDGAYLEFLAQYNRNKLEVTGVHVPPVIAEIQDQVFDSGDKYDLEHGRPKDRATLRTRYVQGGLNVELSGNYYGLQAFRLQEGPAALPDICGTGLDGLRCDSSGDVFLDDGPNWVFDGRLGYKFMGKYELAIGAENLFDKKPPVRPEGFNFLGIFPYNSGSGLSMNGRYVYTQLKVSM